MLSVYAKGSPPQDAINRLHVLIAAVCPCGGGGPSIGRWDDVETWRLDADPEATDAQYLEGVRVMRAFDPWGDVVSEEPEQAEPLAAPAPQFIPASFPDHPGFARADIRAAIISHADALLKVDLDDYDRALKLMDVIIDPATSPEARQDAINEHAQHKGYAAKVKSLIDAREAKLNELNTLDDADLSSFNVLSGWPDDGGS